MLTKNLLKLYLCSIIKLTKITKVSVFFFSLSQIHFLNLVRLRQILGLHFCHWNLNNLTAHDPIKISLLQGYVTQHNYGIRRLLETFLNSPI